MFGHKFCYKDVTVTKVNMFTTTVDSYSVDTRNMTKQLVATT